MPLSAKIQESRKIAARCTQVLDGAHLSLPVGKAELHNAGQDENCQKEGPQSAVGAALLQTPPQQPDPRGWSVGGAGHQESQAGQALTLTREAAGGVFRWPSCPPLLSPEMHSAALCRNRPSVPGSKCKTKCWLSESGVFGPDFQGTGKSLGNVPTQTLRQLCLRDRDMHR